MDSNYQNLTVWQKAMILASDVYILTNEYPKSDLYGLTSQTRRSAVSIPSNVAEGSQRGTKKDFARFLDISRGSSAELETQLLIARNLKYFDNNILFQKIIDNLHEIRKML